MLSHLSLHSTRQWNEQRSAVRVRANIIHCFSPPGVHCAAPNFCHRLISIRIMCSYNFGEILKVAMDISRAGILHKDHDFCGHRVFWSSAKRTLISPLDWIQQFSHFKILSYREKRSVLAHMDQIYTKTVPKSSSEFRALTCTFWGRMGRGFQ